VTTPSAANPYEAPRAELEPAPLPEPASTPATRKRRLGAVLLDGLLYMLAQRILYLGGLRQHAIAAGGNVIELYLRSGPWGYATGTAVLALTVLQWWLIAVRGQSLGKILVGTRIVRLDGRRVDFVHGVVLRSWPLELPALLLPLLGFTVKTIPYWVVAAVLTIDDLFIFGAQKRCLHDRVADTKVIRLGAPPPR
jgi:uncharacterized RDD family membrane protein YckC